MQIRVILVEQLEGVSNNDYIRFPEYTSDQRYQLWSNTIDEIDIPTAEIVKRYGKLF